MNTTKTVITLALSTALGSTGIAQAGENPFGMQVLKQGYQVAEADARSQEGKCGASKAADKAVEAKCGASKAADKTAEGKCGASKTMTKAREGKCGEGKCGANKAKGMEGAE